MQELKPDKTNEIEYDVLIRVKKEKYFLQIRELSIAATGSNLNETYNDLISKKKQLIEAYQDHGIRDELPGPNKKLISNKRSGSSSGPKSYIPFLIKSSAAGVIISLCLVVSVPMMVSSVLGTVTDEAVNASARITKQIDDAFVDGSARIAEQIKAASKVKLGTILEHEIYTAGRREVSPARQEKLIRSIRKIAANYKPVVDEAKLLLFDKN